MFFRFRRWLLNQAFAHRTKALLSTPPLERRAGPLTFVSMVGNEDVHMYLLAMKSLYPRIGYGRIVAIVAPTMPPAGLRLLDAHLGPVEIVRLDSIDTGACQRGGTWERLCHCLDRSEASYVIQVDADILVAGPIEEVAACVRSNRAFTLAEGGRRRTLREVAGRPGGPESDHIVNLAERAMGEYPEPDRHYYIRGSSGFAGFARGAFNRAGIEDFHLNMQRILKGRWTDWGSEQVASNFAIANSPDPLPLPYPKYFTYEGIANESALYHFIGTHRYLDGVYVQKARGVLSRYAALNASCAEALPGA